MKPNWLFTTYEVVYTRLTLQKDTTIFNRLGQLNISKMILEKDVSNLDEKQQHGQQFLEVGKLDGIPVIEDDRIKIGLNYSISYHMRYIL